jgi:hypothetical protein
MEFVDIDVVFGQPKAPGPRADHDAFAGARIDDPAGEAIRGGNVAEEGILNLNRRWDEAKFSLRG